MHPASSSYGKCILIPLGLCGGFWSSIRCHSHAHHSIISLKIVVSGWFYLSCIFNLWFFVISDEGNDACFDIISPTGDTFITVIYTFWWILIVIPEGIKLQPACTHIILFQLWWWSLLGEWALSDLFIWPVDYGCIPLPDVSSYYIRPIPM